MSARESVDYATAEGATTPVTSQATGLADVSHSGETPSCKAHRRRKRFRMDRASLR